MGCSLIAINHKVEAPMRLKNTLIVVEDINKSVAFYKELFGLQVIRDFDGNVIMTEGLVLQERKIFEKFISRECIPRNNMSELYFEEADIEKFVEKLVKAAADAGFETIHSEYIETPKNKMVKDIYKTMGFTEVETSKYELKISEYMET